MGRTLTEPDSTADGADRSCSNSHPYSDISASAPTRTGTRFMLSSAESPRVDYKPPVGKKIADHFHRLQSRSGHPCCRLLLTDLQRRVGCMITPAGFEVDDGDATSRLQISREIPEVHFAMFDVMQDVVHECEIDFIRKGGVVVLAKDSFDIPNPLLRCRCLDVLNQFFLDVNG